jgi:hypothetical protein
LPNAAEVLPIVRKLCCSMYNNALVSIAALIPIALANKLVSVSDLPSAHILETFARVGIPYHLVSKISPRPRTDAGLHLSILSTVGPLHSLMAAWQ